MKQQPAPKIKTTSVYANSSTKLSNPSTRALLSSPPPSPISSPKTSSHTGGILGEFLPPRRRQPAGHAHPLRGLHSVQLHRKQGLSQEPAVPAGLDLAGAAGGGPALGRRGGGRTRTARLSPRRPCGLDVVVSKRRRKVEFVVVEDHLKGG